MREKSSPALFSAANALQRCSFGPTTSATIDRPEAARYFRCVRHQHRDEISLAIGRTVASRLCQQPDLLRVAHENLDRRSRRNADAPSLLHCYEEWREILKRPLGDICELLCSDNEESRRLRQNSPFAGVLSAREIWRLKQKFRDYPGRA